MDDAVVVVDGDDEKGSTVRVAGGGDGDKISEFEFKVACDVKLDSPEKGNCANTISSFFPGGDDGNWWQWG